MTVCLRIDGKQHDLCNQRQEATVLILKIAAALALLQALLTPDFAVQSEVWELQADKWEVRVCAHIVYFAGPFAVEDGGECNQGWTVGVR
jgi:hypothetical protein